MKKLSFLLFTSFLMVACEPDQSSFVAEEQAPAPSIDEPTALDFDGQIGSQSQAATSSKPFLLRKYGPYGSGGTLNTGKSTSKWAAAAVVGFRTFDGDINENGSGKPIYAYPYKEGGTWRVKFDIRSHNNHEGWEVWIMFIDHSMAEVDNF